MDELLEKRAVDFFQDLKTYNVKLQYYYPERRKVRLHHRLLRSKPRGAIYEESVRYCVMALEALKKNENQILVGVLEKLIKRYSAEIRRFSDSIAELVRNADVKNIVDEMTYLKTKLCEAA